MNTLLNPQNTIQLLHNKQATNILLSPNKYDLLTKLIDQKNIQAFEILFKQPKVILSDFIEKNKKLQQILFSNSDLVYFSIKYILLIDKHPDFLEKFQHFISYFIDTINKLLLNKQNHSNKTIITNFDKFFETTILYRGTSIHSLIKLIFNKLIKQILNDRFDNFNKLLKHTVELTNKLSFVTKFFSN